MNENEDGRAVLTRRKALQIGAAVLGGFAVARIIPGCVGGTMGEPFGPPLVVGRHEHGLRLYAFLDGRYRLGYIPKHQGPLIVEMGGAQGDFEFLRNGDEDPLNDQGLATLRLLVNEGEEWQPYRKPFVDEQESMRFETMNEEDVRIMEDMGA